MQLDTTASKPERSLTDNFVSKEGALSAEEPSLYSCFLHTIEIFHESARAVAILLTDESKSTGEEVLRYPEKQLIPIFNRMDNLAEQQKGNTGVTRRAVEEVCAIKTRGGENGGTST